MQVYTAQLPGAETSADRVIVTRDTVIILDGASAFLPVDVTPGTYAETLGRNIANELHEAPGTPLADAVAEAIRRTTEKLDLRPGASPSSTVAILRARPDAADLYVLGDSPIHYGIGHREHSLVDDRLSKVATPERERYRSQLRAGHGYDEAHRAALVQLQQSQRRTRNVEGGYWIAEADPAAAHHALTTTVERGMIEWAVLAPTERPTSSSTPATAGTGSPGTTTPSSPPYSRASMSGSTSQTRMAATCRAPSAMTTRLSRR